MIYFNNNKNYYYKSIPFFKFIIIFYNSGFDKKIA